MSSESELLAGAAGTRRTVAGKERSRLGGGGPSEGCDCAVAAYEDASGAKWPELAYEESPSVRPMTGSRKQRSWHLICLLVRGSIELDSLSATHPGGPGTRLRTPLRRMQPTAGLRQPIFSTGL